MSDCCPRQREAAGEGKTGAPEREEGTEGGEEGQTGLSRADTMQCSVSQVRSASKEMRTKKEPWELVGRTPLITLEKFRDSKRKEV